MTTDLYNSRRAQTSLASKRAERTWVAPDRQASRPSRCCHHVLISLPLLTLASIVVFVRGPTVESPFACLRCLDGINHYGALFDFGGHSATCAINQTSCNDQRSEQRPHVAPLVRIRACLTPSDLHVDTRQISYVPCNGIPV